MHRSRLVALSFVALAAVPSLAAPRFPAQPVQAEQAKPNPAQVYDEKADARADVAAALARAKKENRRVLIQWGANWCGWCVLLHGAMSTNKDVRKELLYEYDVVHVDVGRFDKNMDLASELGAKFEGIPFLTILDANGKALVQQETGSFESDADGKPGHDPQKLVEFLTRHKAPPLDAAAVRDAALARAKTEGKRVFLHFGAPWCGWCHKLEGWMAQPDVAARLDKEFFDLKIDTDRMTGGADLMKATRAAAGLKEGGGIPWIALLDANGATLAHSDGPAGNIGCPYKDEEIAHFVTMLDAARAKLTPADVVALQESLVRLRNEDEARRKAAEAASKQDT